MKKRMTREEAMDIFEHNWTRLVNADYTEEELNKAIEMAIKALEQEPCEDCVSREDVLKGRTYTSTEEGWEGYTIDEDYVKSLPSVQPKRDKEDTE